MRYSRVIAVVGVIIMLIACNKPHKNDMKAQLDKIRAMVVQSALISVQAACTEPSPNSKLVDGALALLRRATAGPEMMRIHQMMGQMQMDKPGDLLKKSDNQNESPEQAMHIAVHAAGGDGFDLLDAMTRSPGLTCDQILPVSLAATAALLRQHHEKAMSTSADKILDKEIDTAAEKLGNSVQASITDKTPEPVRILALALQKI
jgi:CheY-like chemotaxis protein